MAKYYFTEKQLEVDKWLHEMGFSCMMEYSVNEFTIDCFCPELNWGIEILGPRHYKKEFEKRKKKLLEYGIKNIVFVPVSIGKEEFTNLMTQELLKEESNDREGIEREGKEYLSCQ